MNRQVYQRGINNTKWGIWNAKEKCFQFNICKDTPMLAEARLFQKIGDDARKWKFEIKMLPKEKHRGEAHFIPTNPVPLTTIYGND